MAVVGNQFFACAERSRTSMLRNHLSCRGPMRWSSAEISAMRPYCAVSAWPLRSNSTRVVVEGGSRPVAVAVAEQSLVGHQNMLAPMLMSKASTVVLNR